MSLCAYWRYLSGFGLQHMVWFPIVEGIFVHLTITVCCSCRRFYLFVTTVTVNMISFVVICRMVLREALYRKGGVNERTKLRFQIFYVLSWRKGKPKLCWRGETCPRDDGRGAWPETRCALSFIDDSTTVIRLNFSMPQTQSLSRVRCRMLLYFLCY